MINNNSSIDTMMTPSSIIGLNGKELKTEEDFLLHEHYFQAQQSVLYAIKNVAENHLKYMIKKDKYK